MNNEKIIAEKLLQISAIKLSPHQPFTWASGWKSPIYCDNRKALSFTEVRDLIKMEMSRIITLEFPQASMLAGVATAGIAWGALVADHLKLPFMYVRPKPKEHGLGNQIEGFYESNSNVVVIEDLVSTGKSSLQVVEVLRKQDVHVAGMISIFNYEFEIAKNLFEEAGIKFKSLTNYQTLVDLAIEKQIILPDDENTLLNWRLNPSKWKQDN